jgi:hypothetical protein
MNDWGHERESAQVLLRDDEGNETIGQALTGGKPGPTHGRDPKPGTPEWEQIVQAALNSAARAEPPATLELDIWTRVAKEKLPLAFVNNNSGTYSLVVPEGWGLAEGLGRLVDEEIREPAEEIMEGDIIDPPHYGLTQVILGLLDDYKIVFADVPHVIFDANAKVCVLTEEQLLDTFGEVMEVLLGQELKN